MLLDIVCTERCVQYMEKVILEFPVSKLGQIKQLVEWNNYSDELMSTNKQYTVDDFIIGATLEKLDFFNNIVINDQRNIDINHKLVNRFKTIASERDIKQVDICKRIGISKATLSQVFNNKISINMELFFKIWICLKCPPMNECFDFTEK